MFPNADIPVFQLSLDYSFNDWHPKPLEHHFDMAKELAPLRERGVLIIGSGNIVHNLGLVDFGNEDAEPFGWARDFDGQVRSALLDGNDRALVRYASMGPSASLAVPTLDHYLPLIYAIALREQNEPLVFAHEGFQHASISMRSLQIGYSVVHLPRRCCGRRTDISGARSYLQRNHGTAKARRSPRKDCIRRTAPERETGRDRII